MQERTIEQHGMPYEGRETRLTVTADTFLIFGIAGLLCFRFNETAFRIGCLLEEYELTTAVNYLEIMKQTSVLRNSLWVLRAAFVCMVFGSLICIFRKRSMMFTEETSIVVSTSLMSAVLSYAAFLVLTGMLIMNGNIMLIRIAANGLGTISILVICIAMTICTAVTAFPQMAAEQT